MYKVLSTEPSPKESRLTDVPLTLAEIKKKQKATRNRSRKMSQLERASLFLRVLRQRDGGTPWNQGEPQTLLAGRIKGSSEDCGGGCTAL